MTPEREYRSVDALLTEHARRRGAKVYAESIAQRASLTFAELDAATNRVAHFLADRDLRANQRVTLLSDNSLEFLVLFFGVQRYGATVNPINIEVNAKNVAQMLSDVEPALVLWSQAIPEELRAVVARSGYEAIPFGDLGADDFWHALSSYSTTPCQRRVGNADAIGLINYTSGTTAKPKGVCISHEAFFYQCRSPAESLGLTENDRVLEYRAMSWASPQLLSVGATLQAGATLVFAPRFSQSRFFDWIRDYEITISAGVPTAISMLIDRPSVPSREAIRTLKFITSSSAPLPVARQQEFERHYSIPIVQACGMTEAGFMAGNPPDACRLGSIGVAMPHIRATFVDESGTECAPGQQGELVVSGPQMARAYLVDRGALTEIPQDGFRTGDIGYQDADGYLYLTGRKKDLIIKGGVNIAPMEITSVLLAHPAVGEAATIGVPDEIYGEAIVSFVAAHAGQSVTTEELMAHCRARLSPFKLPGQIILLEALPMVERGKVSRQQLLDIWLDRQRAEAQAGAQAPPQSQRVDGRTGGT